MRFQGVVLDVRIKWPNDIYSGSLKLGGILCHSAYRDRIFHVTVGVGLNVANRQPTTCIEALMEAAAASAAAGGEGTGAATLTPVNRELLLAEIVNRLEGMLDRLGAEGFGPYEEAYYEAWLHSGQELQLEEGGSRVGVRVAGLSQHGYLLAVDDEGESYELHPDGNRCAHGINVFGVWVAKGREGPQVCLIAALLSLRWCCSSLCSLDFFQGLVRKKIT
jgi:biotin--protein ligase